MALRNGSALALLLSLVAIVFAPWGLRAEQPSQLNQLGYLSDYGGYINDQSRGGIEAICRQLEAHAGYRLLFVTVKTTGNLTPGQFSGQLRDFWVKDEKIRERTLIFLVNGQGRFGGSQDDSLDPTLTHPKLDAIMKSSFALGGNNYGIKLESFARQVAETLDPTGNYAAVAAAGRRSAPGRTAANRSSPAVNSIQLPEWMQADRRRLEALLLILMLLAVPPLAYLGSRRGNYWGVIFYGALCVCYYILIRQ